ncbi:MAG: carboxypeptidase regulatory-like domain-containing protein [Chloroflexi bacterium]|nr:carboxypeptidase regulatory-like domain-containing protein [Chloroflexota bacterium]
MRIISKFVYVGIVIIGLLLMGGCTASPTLIATTVPTGGLEGTVSDVSTGDPVTDAQVTIAGQVGVFTVTTDPDGKYDVADLPAGAYLINVQATGYYVQAVQVGVVADVVSSGNIALEPAVAVIVTATPAPTSIPTRTPTPLSPTLSPTSTPPSTPTATSSPTPVSKASPPQQSRPMYTHAVPVLLEPRDESEFSGPQQITFRWTGVCCLATDEYYVVSIPHPLGVEEGWVKTTHWEVPDYLYLLAPESRLLAWSVSVRRHTGEYPNGQWKGPIVSGISETWRFWWYGSGGGARTSPLPRPVSPLSVP